MNLKLLAAAAACSLTAVTAASAQTVYMSDTAYIEPAPAYTYVTPAPVYRSYFPGDYVQPQVTVVQPQIAAPPAYTVQPGPRYSYNYNRGYYGINYAAPLSCTIDAFGNRVCD
jgi:hypothetical protein